MITVGRNWEVGSEYRYGFNGQEQDDEVYGNGNLNCSDFWEYNTRLGRRWNKDPIIKEWESPFACFSNNPILYVDIHGSNADWFEHKNENGSTSSIWNPSTENEIILDGQTWTNTGTVHTSYTMFSGLNKDGSVSQFEMTTTYNQNILVSFEAHEFITNVLNSNIKCHPDWMGMDILVFNQQLKAQEKRYNELNYSAGQVNYPRNKFWDRLVGPREHEGYEVSYTGYVKDKPFIEYDKLIVPDYIGGPKSFPTVGAGAKLTYLTAEDIITIQNIANKYGVEISVVGSRARGEATIASDWDYIISGGNKSRRQSAFYYLPSNTSPQYINAIRARKENLGQLLNPDLPYITFKPQ